MKTFKKIDVNKRAILFLVLLFAAAALSFAADEFGLEPRVGMIVKFLTSPWVSGIAFVALVIECIAMITAGRQEPGMFKKFLPWIIGTLVFMAAPTITTAFLDLSTSNQSAALEKLKLDK